MVRMAADAVKCERDVRFFARQAWRIVEPKAKYLHNWHIDAIGRHLEAVTNGDIRRLIINMPPRHMKSLMVAVFWMCWQWTFSPATRWIFSSYAQNLSKRDSLKCRRIISSPWYQLNWGDRVRLTSDQNQKMRFENDATGYRIATSVGGTGTGEGGGIVVSDDAHKAGEYHSPVMLKRACSWWDEEMSSRGDDPKTCAHVIMGQRIHMADISGHTLAKGGYERLVLPAVFNGKRYVTSIGFEDKREKIGELLWEQRFPQAEIDELILRMGPQIASGQLGQEPVAPGGNIIKGAWIEPYYYTVAPTSFDSVILVWDSAHGGDANKENPESSFSVGGAIGSVGADYYLLELTRGQWDLPDELEAFQSFCIAMEQKYDVQDKVVENKAHGRSIVQTFKHVIEGIVAINPVKSKAVRLDSVSYLFRAGNVHLPKFAPWKDIVVAELCGFPAFATNDCVDIVSMGLIYLRENETDLFMC
jgi:predicted phage terminase large subunit-like protein